MPLVANDFDPVLASPGRLRILTALAGAPGLEFVQLRQETRLTDGNLCTHTRRLETAGFVAVQKTFRDRKPVTQVHLTNKGREALESHARELLAALRPGINDERAAPTSLPTQAASDVIEEDPWID